MAEIDVIDNPLLEAALNWTRKGFAVVPVGRDKRPKVAWRGLQTTPWTEEQVTAWWTANPDDNVAVIPGSRDMAVLDADVYKTNGTEDLVDLFIEHGIDHSEMTIARTGSGGRHYWFHAPGGLPSRPLTDTIDIKSNGGIVMVPPSVNNAGAYTWEQSDDVSSAPMMPRSLFEVASAQTQGGTNTERTKPIVSGELVTLARAMDGREKVMADAVWWAGHRMLAEGLSLEDTEQWLEIAYERFRDTAKGRGGVPLEVDHPPEAMLYKIRNTNLVALQQSHAKNAAANDSQSPSEVVQGGVEGVEIGSSTAEPTRRRRYVLEPWGSDDFPGDNDFLIRGLLSPGSLSVLYGPSNSGKTFQAMAIAFAVGTGTEFYGMETARGRVVYLAAEGATNIRKRRAAIKIAFAEQIEELEEEPAIDLIGDSFDFCTPDSEDVTALVEDIGKADLIIIDTLAAVAVGGDENTAPTMLAIIANCNRLIRETGAHVMLIHHMGKDEERGARGHSSLRAALDTEIECLKTSGTDIGRLKVTKQRDMEMGQPLGFKLVPVVIREGSGLGTDDLTSCYVEQTNYRPNSTRKAGLTRALERIILNKFASADRYVRRPQRIEVNGTMIQVVDAIDSDTIRNSFRSLPENDGVDGAKLRMRYRRALREVCSQGSIVYGSEKIGLLRETAEPKA